MALPPSNSLRYWVKVDDVNGAKGAWEGTASRRTTSSNAANDRTNGGTWDVAQIGAR